MAKEVHAHMQDEPDVQPADDASHVQQRPPATADKSNIWLLVTLSLSAVISAGVAIVIYRSTGDMRYALACGASTFSILITLLTLALNG